MRFHRTRQDVRAVVQPFPVAAAGRCPDEPVVYHDLRDRSYLELHYVKFIIFHRF